MSTTVVTAKCPFNICDGSGYTIPMLSMESIMGPMEFSRQNKVIECKCQAPKRVAMLMGPALAAIPVKSISQKHVDVWTDHLLDAVRDDKHVPRIPNINVRGAIYDFGLLLKVYYNVMGNPWLQHREGIRVLEKHIRVTSDRVIKEVQVGSHQRRHLGDEYKGSTYENIDEFILPPDILVVQLGPQQSSNREAAN